MLNAGERLVKLGRNFGIGCSLISQRPQEVNKKVLNQTEVLLVFQMTGLQERKTIKEWVRDKGNDFDETYLPKLETGEALIWSPTWLKISGTYKIAEKQTADVSATPEVGSTEIRVNTLTKVDVAELRKSIEVFTADQEANTPAALKKRIAELERELDNLRKNANTVTAEPHTIKVPVLDEQRIDKAQLAFNSFRREFRERSEFLRETMASMINEMIDMNTYDVDVAIGELRTGEPKLSSGLNLPANEISIPPKASKPVNTGVQSGIVSTAPDKYHNEHGVSKFTTFTPSKTQQRILDAVAWYESIGNSAPSPTQIGAVALIDPTGGHFSNTVGPLSSNGLIVREHGSIRLTPDGRFLARVDDSPKTLDGYHDGLRQRVLKMKSASRRTIDMLDTLIAAGGSALSNKQIGQAIGIDHTGGHFSNTIGPLSTAGLIRRGNGMVEPTEVLFPEGLK